MPVLTIDTPTKPILSGTINYLDIQSNQIKIAGDLVAGWTPYRDYLFSIDNTYFFYWHIISFDGTNTILTGIQWANNVKCPTTGGKPTAILYASKTPVFNKTLCTVGDSLTWYNFGQYYRTLLLEHGLQYDFVGNHTDIFGYQHSAEGGDGTASVLNRMDKIPFADNYLLLIGLNDRVIYTPQDCFNNILRIVSQLEARGKKVNVCTLLPVTIPEAISHVTAVNCLLRAHAWRSTTNLIDTNLYLTSITSWASMIPDGGHPNLDGYQILSEYVAQNIV